MPLRKTRRAGSASGSRSQLDIVWQTDI